MIKPYSMSRFLSIFHCECEYEVDGNLVFMWEPLYPYNATLDQTARPSWQDDHITFYREEEKDWIRVNRHLMFSRGASPDVVMLSKGLGRGAKGLFVEITGGQVVWREDRWFVRWRGYTNTRAASLVRAGIEWWKDPEREMPEANHA